MSSRCLLLITLTAFGTRSVAQDLDPPYPKSETLVGVQWHWETFDQRAPGSDIWPITWSDDGNQYTAWGDGGGFGGTNQRGRVPLGVARISGDWRMPSYKNVWGGHDAERPATFGGKSFGLISVDGVLYTWWAGDDRDMSLEKWGDNTILNESRIAVSKDYGKSWSLSDWKFSKSDLLYCPTFINCGKDNSAAQDDYVYSFLPRLNRTTELWFNDEKPRVSQLRRPGRADLTRVPSSKVRQRDAYEFFTGCDAAGKPTWTKELSERKPAFEDPNGFRVLACIYNPGLQRYLLTIMHSEVAGPAAAGNLGIFESEKPWGPWQTVSYQHDWGAENAGGPGEISGVLTCNFAPKWFSDDGKQFTLVFTDDDHWASVRGTFRSNRNRAAAFREWSGQ